GENRDPGDALNQELLSYGNDKPAHIIGVIDDERQSSILAQSKPEIEVCIPQITPKTGFYRVAEGLAMNLVVRTQREPSLMIAELRRVFRDVSPELAGSSFTTMDQVVDASYGDRRMASQLLQLFAGSALLLCIVGLYGSLAYLVTQRTRELGVRLALGAQRHHLMWQVMGRAVLILALGSAIGIAISLGATRMISNMIYGVRPYDAVTLTGATLILMTTGFLASYIPARRAANVDPMQALRAE
ncbi:MAG TPA: FtsX-like permease family protein, partial [Terriglobales bacterium]|nr:FtsX-like permease family protein [Terriglobales bacterium]